MSYDDQQAFWQAEELDRLHGHLFDQTVEEVFEDESWAHSSE